MIATIARRELKGLFASPLAWVLLAVVQIILAWLFLNSVDQFLGLQGRLAQLPNPPGVTDVVAAPLLSSTSIVLLMIMPLITMRLISEERRSGTLALLVSAPVSVTEIVVGKFLGLVVFLAVAVAMIALMPLALSAGTQVDLGQLAGGLIGLLLIVAAFAAIGLFMSSLTRQPMIAALGTFGALLLLWVISFAAGKSPAFEWLSPMRHLDRLLQGLMNTTDVAYYLIVIGLFLALTIRRLDGDRLQP